MLHDFTWREIMTSDFARVLSITTRHIGDIRARCTAPHTSLAESIGIAHAAHHPCRAPSLPAPPPLSSLGGRLSLSLCGFVRGTRDESFVERRQCSVLLYAVGRGGAKVGLLDGLHGVPLPGENRERPVDGAVAVAPSRDDVVRSSSLIHH